MKYYGFLALVLACLIASVLVQGQNLFRSAFFAVAYVVMGMVLVIGSKNEESWPIDMLIGLLLIFCIAFLSTETLAGMFSGRFGIDLPFRFMIIIALDYCALGFLREGMKIKKAGNVIEDDRYRIG